MATVHDNAANSTYMDDQRKLAASLAPTSATPPPEQVAKGSGAATSVTIAMAVVFSFIGAFVLYRFGIRRCVRGHQIQTPAKRPRRRASHAYPPDPSDPNFGIVLSQAECDALFPEHPFRGEGEGGIAPGYREYRSAHSPPTEKGDASGEDKFRDEEMGCAVCLAAFRPGLPVRTVPCCSRGFHSACLEEWVTARRAVCPVCRFAFHRRGVDAAERGERRVHAGYEELAAAREAIRRGAMGGAGRAPTVVAVAEVPAAGAEGGEMVQAPPVARPEPARLGD